MGNVCPPRMNLQCWNISLFSVKGYKTVQEKQTSWGLRKKRLRDERNYLSSHPKFKLEDYPTAKKWIASVLPPAGTPSTVTAAQGNELGVKKQGSMTTFVLVEIQRKQFHTIFTS